MKKEKEKAIELYIIRKTNEIGGITIKGSATNAVGFPDRIILIPGGSCSFLEVKTQGKKPTGIQEHWLTRLSNIGFKSECVDTKKKVDLFFDEIKK